MPAASAVAPSPKIRVRFAPVTGRDGPDGASGPVPTPPSPPGYPPGRDAPAPAERLADGRADPLLGRGAEGDCGGAVLGSGTGGGVAGSGPGGIVGSGSGGGFVGSGSWVGVGSRAGGPLSAWDGFGSGCVVMAAEDVLV